MLDLCKISIVSAYHKISLFYLTGFSNLHFKNLAESNLLIETVQFKVQMLGGTQQYYFNQWFFFKKMGQSRPRFG